MDYSKTDRIGSLGVASLQPDGTLKLDLRRSFDTRFNFHKVLFVRLDNPRYKQYVDRIGGIAAGERKVILAE